MCKLDLLRTLPILGWMTLAAAAPQIALSQTPSQTQDASAGPAVTVPSPPPTHEELGDTLSVHRRYQAAIEEYGKATSSAAVWNKMGIAYQMMFNLKDGYGF